jgi:hypothetical protein
MSLEKNIEALTAAILKLTNALGEPRSALPAEKPAPEAEKPKAEKPAPKPKAEKPKPAPEPKADEGVTLKQLGPAMVSLMKAKGQDAGIKLLQKYDVAKVSLLPPEKFADFLADIQAELG